MLPALVMLKSQYVKDKLALSSNNKTDAILQVFLLLAVCCLGSDTNETFLI